MGAVGNEALDVPYGKGLVDFASSACGLAGVGADPSAYAGQNVVLPDQLKRFGVLASARQGHVSLDIYPERAVGLAKRGPAFVDYGPARKSVPSAELERFFAVRADGWASLRTKAAKRASLAVYVGWRLLVAYRKSLRECV